MAGEEGLEGAEAAGTKLQAHALVHLAAAQNLRLDAFSLGPAASLLGEEVCAGWSAELRA